MAAAGWFSGRITSKMCLGIAVFAREAIVASGGGRGRCWTVGTQQSASSGQAVPSGLFLSLWRDAGRRSGTRHQSMGNVLGLARTRCGSSAVPSSPPAITSPDAPERRSPLRLSASQPQKLRRTAALHHSVYGLKSVRSSATQASGTAVFRHDRPSIFRRLDGVGCGEAEIAAFPSGSRWG